MHCNSFEKWLSLSQTALRKNIKRLTTGHGGRDTALRRELGETASSEHLGGSSKYSNKNFGGRSGERFHKNYVPRGISVVFTWGVMDF